MFLDDAIAVASDVFEAPAIENRKSTPLIANDARPLQGGRRQAEGGPVDAEHSGQELVGEGQLMLIRPVLAYQRPSG